ncbi:ankyrin repeat and LEM domain-containing protein 1 [Engraulis encrasicolus]|uniref:ankyrin repeat and LEM domain-containing protein 1 n=1 Tax=Engraulis encrasicolus TaxID=184585 RepID=UPI002FD4474A
MNCATNITSQLCQAVGNEDARSVQTLLSQGANPNLILDKGVAAIHLAVGKESEKGIRCLKLILQHGADPNLRSSEGLTPLHIAALWGCYQTLKLLLKNGANPNLKDQDGNKAGRLAKQQDNRRCAMLLSEHESQAAQAEVEDFPKFQYSVYSGQPGRECSYSSAGDDYSNASLGMSMLSDMSEDPLSSTRRSSCLNFSSVFSGRPSLHGGGGGGWAGGRLEVSDISDLRGPQDSVLEFDPPSILSSTRMSVAGIRDRSGLPVLQGDETVFDGRALRYDHGFRRPSDVHPPPAGYSRRASRKSVSFRDVDEYYPVFDVVDSPRRLRPVTQESSESCDSTVDFSEYTEFFDAERMATVLHHQGIDVTSPDHVYVFTRDDDTSSNADLEKTVLTWLPTEEEENQDDVATECVSEPESKVQPLPPSGSSSSSGTSKYSSCDSEDYKSCIGDASPLDDLHRSTEEDEGTQQGPSADHQSNTVSNTQVESDITQMKRDSAQDERSACIGTEPSTVAEVAELLSNLTCDSRTKDLEDEGCDVVVSPFVTGRTRSRLSRCSQRASQSSSSLSSTSLFEVTLPTPPTRMRRTVRSQDSPADGYCASPFLAGRCGGSLATDCSQSQVEVLRAEQGMPSYEGLSQADTVLLSTSMADTIILESGGGEKCPMPFGVPKGLMSESDFEQEEDIVSSSDLITDDLSTCSDVRSLSPSQGSTQSSNRESVEDSWVSEMESQFCSSQASVSDTPQKYAPDTPGTGCTPRYSMSRLSGGHCRPRSLANLSYTPGGRPHLVDVDEPVEYLYTDTEEGHELIETHVPPTSNTSMSTTTTSSSGDETVLYDWRAFKVSPSKGKENVEPKEEALSKELKGLTDKELRRRLVELGHAPGPITARTRPVYMERLLRLQQEANSQPQSSTEHSPELRKTLQTFILPDGRNDEHALSQQFDQPDQNKKWREGVIKSSFNYLLLDPRVTNNLPFRSQAMTPKECFQTFASAIFYVGKGKRSRPYSHLYEALDYYRGDKTSKKLCSKVKHILDVWNAGHGVISLHCFQNVIPVEAYTREACMVDAIGLKMLTNKKRGDYYGVASTWAAKRKRELGVHLLYRAMQIFLAEGERQLRPADIRAGN